MPESRDLSTPKARRACEANLTAPCSACGLQPACTLSFMITEMSESSGNQAISRPVIRMLLIGLTLVAILLAAAFVRGRLLTRQALFMDEAWNLELASGRGSLHLRLEPQVLHDNVPRVSSIGNDAPPLRAIW